MDEARIEQIRHNVAIMKLALVRVRTYVAIILGIIIITLIAQLYLLYEYWQAIEEVSRVFDGLRKLK